MGFHNMETFHHFYAIITKTLNKIPQNCAIIWWCIRDLKAYSQSLRGSLAYYHDRYDLETNAVLRIAKDQFALIEFKLGSSEIEEGAKHLIEIQNLIREYNKKETQVPLCEPDLLIVLTGGQLAYTRDDGVKVVPLVCLRD